MTFIDQIESRIPIHKLIKLNRAIVARLRADKRITFDTREKLAASDVLLAALLREHPATSLGFNDTEARAFPELAECRISADMTDEDVAYWLSIVAPH